MHPRIVELEEKLFALTKKPPARPTPDDRKSLMDVLKEINGLRDEAGVTLDASDEQRRQELQVEATTEEKRLSAFFVNNGNKWAL